MTEQPQERKNIYQRIHAVMEKVDYVQKEAKKNGMQYSFVSHDSVTAAVRPHLVTEGVIYFPQNLTYKQDGNRTEVTLDLEFTCVDNPQDKLIVPAFGFGIDSQDKGPGKAVSYAVKYALLKTFGLETGDDPERDSVDHQPPVKNVPAANKAPPVFVQQLQPAKEPTFKTTEQALAWMQSAKTFIQGLHSPEDITNWITVNGKFIAELKPKQREWIDEVITKRRAAVIQAPLKTNGAARHA